MTHLIPYDHPSVGRHQVRALCGELVDRVADAAVNGTPTCPECQRLDAQAAADLAALEADDLAQRQADYGV